MHKPPTRKDANDSTAAIRSNGFIWIQATAVTLQYKVTAVNRNTAGVAQGNRVLTPIANRV
jgi:hypothetical protein